MSETEILCCLVDCIGDADGKNCIDCPLYAIDECQDFLNRDIMKLIKRQKAEIDRLKGSKSTSLTNAPKWISIKDRLPETSGYYLTCDQKGNVHSLYYHEEQQFPFAIEPWNACYYMPKYWMPAPEPPKED